MSDSHVPLPPPVVEIERRIRWPAPAALAFLGFLAVLLLMAILPIVAPPHVLEGLPSDPDVRAASEIVRDMVPVAGSELAFSSALFGDERAGGAVAPTRLENARVRSLLDRARLRIGADPRLAVFLAHLDLADGAAENADPHRAFALLHRAEDGYRSITDGRTEVPEARVGLGALLALAADREPDSERRRGLRLMAIAQFAAVKANEQAYLAALYDRALLLARVGRRAEARKWAAEYFRRDSTSPRAQRLRAEVGFAG